MIRVATKDDRDIFLEMWSENIDELSSLGHDLVQGDQLVSVFADYFDAYVSGSARGVVLIDDESGIAIWGEPLIQRRPPYISYAWGTYVRKEFRGQGIARKLREVAASELMDLGFTHAISTVLAVNDAALETAKRMKSKVISSQLIGELRDI